MNAVGMSGNNLVILGPVHCDGVGRTDNLDGSTTLDLWLEKRSRAMLRQRGGGRIGRVMMDRVVYGSEISPSGDVLRLTTVLDNTFPPPVPGVIATPQFDDVPVASVKLGLTIYLVLVGDATNSEIV
jgi:hypothetical protein